MLRKTLDMLKGIEPGAYLADEICCYDDAEIEQLGQLLQRLIWAPSQLRRRLQRMGVTITPNNFYSEIPSIDDIEWSFTEGDSAKFDCIFDHARMVAYLDQNLFPYSSEFDPPLEPGTIGQYAWKGGPFSYSDAMAYYCFIRHVKPRSIIEVGSGWSTLVADAACRANGSGKIICVEPSPADFLHHVASVKSILACPVQQLAPDYFNEMMSDGDILFIDSTHTVKHGSDCLHLYLNVLPQLRSSLFVHVHDVYLPDTLPLSLLRDRHIYWTEQYLVMAYLIGNCRTKVLYGSNYHLLRNYQRLAAFMHGRLEPGGASLWFVQDGAAVMTGRHSSPSDQEAKMEDLNV